MLFALAVQGSSRAIFIGLVWIGLQSAVALSGFYLATRTLPPHLFLATAPPIILIAALFLTVGGRRFLDRMSLKWSVLIHSIRILVELNLYVLFLYKQVPALMTFEAGNLDILAGLSAPLIWWAYRKGRVGRMGLLIWNALALLSVLNAFGRAMLSAPFRFQRFAFRSANCRDPCLPLRAASSISGSGGPALPLCCDLQDCLTTSRPGANNVDERRLRNFAESTNGRSCRQLALSEVMRRPSSWAVPGTALRWVAALLKQRYSREMSGVIKKHRLASRS